MKKKYFILILICFIVTPKLLKSQKSKVYYPLINKAEKKLVEGDLDSSLYFYDKALEDFKFPFYKHIKQAAIVAHYNKNSKLLLKYLTKCIERGMNKDELCFFIRNNKTDSIVQQISINFQFHKNIYAKSIDSLLLNRYLEFDYFDEYFLLKKYKNVNKNKDEIRKIQGEALKKYIQLIHSHGFPSEKNVGLDVHIYENGCTWEECKRVKLENYYKLVPDSDNYIFVSEEKGVMRGENTKPGNRFIWHYNHDSLIDKEYLLLMKNAFNNLEMSASNLIYYFETSEGTNYKDFFYTYESHSLLEGLDKFNLDSNIENKINDNRKKYFVRTIKMEKNIFEKLYELEYLRKPKKLNRKSKEKIKFTFYSFLYYY